MRISYRSHNVRDYWEKRWDDIPADQPMENNQVYPLKYAEQTVKDQQGKILEAGCGAGRILRQPRKMGGCQMKIWYLIRRPIGYVLFAAIGYAVLIFAHAIPYLLTDWILGL